MSNSRRIASSAALILALCLAPTLGGCVVAGVAGAAVGVTASAVGATAKVAGAAVGVTADAAGAVGHAVIGGGKPQK
jgi:hypothetical protein